LLFPVAAIAASLALVSKEVAMQTERQAMELRETMPTSLRDYRMLLESIVACEAAGVVGGVATATSVKTWFPTLRKPSFSPPGAVFGPVWTILYLLMGLSLYATRKAGERGAENDPAIRLFALQLALNALWSVVFFGARSPRWAMVEILFLWAAIALTMRAIWKISRGAALLLAPYLLWTTFASVLNFRIWRLNR
jgi:tryptophan-rich sensory protein